MHSSKNAKIPVDVRSSCSRNLITTGEMSELFFGPIMISDTAHLKISSLINWLIFECSQERHFMVLL